MNPNDLATRYHLLNSSFKKTMIYHIGIDAGFFTEYTYMLHAMLYCLQHKICLLYTSDDADDTKYSSSFTPTTPTSDGKKVGKIVSPPSASKCTNRFITLITPIASPPGRH